MNEGKPTDKVVLNLIYKGDKLVELLYQLKDAGYEPSIKYEGGKLTHIGLTLEKKVHILIRTQQLTINDGECNVSSAEIYNNMNSAMNKFNNALFKSEHKSYYSKQDIDILDEYRTVVPIGLFTEVVDDLVEIDVSKAFTYAFSQIVEIPIFNEFDSFTIYNNEPISLNNLYIVKVESGNFFKKIKLIYAMESLSVIFGVLPKLSHINDHHLLRR